MKLPLDFYLSNDVVEVSQKLLGKVLCTNRNGRITKVVITETEAYAGTNDYAQEDAKRPYRFRVALRTDAPVRKVRTPSI
jgi:3-methyladenine DNA glycosylase Mpg